MQDNYVYFLIDPIAAVCVQSESRPDLSFIRDFDQDTLYRVHRERCFIERLDTDPGDIDDDATWGDLTWISLDDVKEIH